MPVHHHEHSHVQIGNDIHPDRISGRKIFFVTLLNAVITIAEIIGGIISGSLALLSDALHNLSDTMAVALSYFAYKISRRKNDKKMTFGYRRAEVLAALVNAVVLVAVSVWLIVEAVRRFRTPEIINGTLMIVVALIGLIANIVCVFLLEKDSHGSLNIRSSYLHLLGDTLSSVGVLFGGLAIQLWGIVWIDPLITILVAVYIMYQTRSILVKVVDILMQSAAPLDYEKIIADIEQMEKVNNIHHIHSWRSDEKTIYFEAHIDMSDMMLSDAEPVYQKIEKYLIEDHGISHVTLQIEAGECCNHFDCCE